MRRASLLATLAFAAAAAAAPAAYAASSETTPPPLRATVESCETSPLEAERVATFVGSMPARAGANRMHIRFDLERRRPGDRHWRRLKAPGFGTWERSAANVAGFVFRKRVIGLPVPASYRTWVRFRWIAADGTTVRAAQARTLACTQPDLRPNLVPGALTAIVDAQPGLAVYTLAVRNTGRSAASGFNVRVGTGVAEFGPLDPGEQRSIAMIALACAPGTTIVASVDEDGRVDESSERANSTRRHCPLTLG